MVAIESVAEPFEIEGAVLAVDYLHV